MLTILGSIIGFVTSTGPGIFKTIMDAKQHARDQEHELKLMAQQSADRRDEAVITSAGLANIAVQESSQENIKRASVWVVNLSATVRPVIAYAFFFLFATLSILAAFDVISEGHFSEIWTEEIQAIFAAIISFYYGNRLTSKWVK